MGAVPLTVMEVAPDFHRLPSDPQMLRNLGGIFESVFMIPEGWTEVNAEKRRAGARLFAQSVIFKLSNTSISVYFWLPDTMVALSSI